MKVREPPVGCDPDDASSNDAAFCAVCRSGFWKATSHCWKSYCLGSARCVRARERLAVDFESTALDLPLAWHRICRLRARP